MSRRKDRQAVAREIYVGLVVAMRRQFLTEPGMDDLTRLRDLADRAGAVWVGEEDEYAEYVLCEQQEQQTSK